MHTITRKIDQSVVIKSSFAQDKLVQYAAATLDFIVPLGTTITFKEWSHLIVRCYDSIRTDLLANILFSIEHNQQ